MINVSQKRNQKAGSYSKVQFLGIVYDGNRMICAIGNMSWGNFASANPARSLKIKKGKLLLRSLPFTNNLCNNYWGNRRKTAPGSSTAT